MVTTILILEIGTSQKDCLKWVVIFIITQATKNMESTWQKNTSLIQIFLVNERIEKLRMGSLGQLEGTNMNFGHRKMQ